MRAQSALLRGLRASRGTTARVGSEGALQDGTMIVLQVRIEAHPPQRRELVHALLRWADAARAEPLLTGCRLYEDLEEPGVFGLVAKWSDATALEMHLRSEPFGVLQGALEVLARPVQFEVLQPTASSLLRKVAM